MKFTERTVLEVDDWCDIEKLMQDFFKDEYFCLAEQLDVHNGADCTFIVREDNPDHEMELEEAHLRYKDGRILLYNDGVTAVLEHYARQGVVPFGTYLATISW